MTVKDRNSVWEAHLIAGGTEKPGELLSFHGKVWIGQFNRAPEVGDKIAYRSDRVVEGDKNAGGDIYAVGADVWYQPASGNVYTADPGGGAFLAGKVRKASGATDNTVVFGLND